MSGLYLAHPEDDSARYLAVAAIRFLSRVKKLAGENEAGLSLDDDSLNGQRPKMTKLGL